MMLESPSQQNEVFTVSALNATARGILEGTFSTIQIEGEISNFVRPASGHIYLTLKDEKAQVRCAFFRGRNRFLNFTPKNGMQIIARAQVSLYEGRGEFQLILQSMEEVGDGALRRAFEALKNRLNQEGLFSDANKKPLPKLPSSIGVITSPTGAAVRDIVSVLKRRFPAIPVIIYPSQVQGHTAPQQLIKALERAHHRKECDILILARGGGSLEDLWCFNDEKLARAIFKSTIPIVSGVGHEIDFTIADFVADQRAATPSAAAELIVPNQEEWLNQFNQHEKRLIQCAKQWVRENQLALKAVSKQLRHPGDIIREKMQHLDYMEQRLIRHVKMFLKHSNIKFEALCRALNTVSPLATLDRGYAIVKDKKTDDILCDAKTVKKGDKITARLAKGKLDCVVENVNYSNL